MPTRRELLHEDRCSTRDGGGETRVALTPQIAGQLVGDGHEVLVQAGAGEASSSLDEAYREAGATIVPDAAQLYSQAEMVLRVGRPSDEEVEMLRSGSVLIGTLGTLARPELAQKLAERGVTAISMDAIPRITRAQSMDTLLQPGNGRRLQGGPDRRGPAAEVLPPADHRRRHDPAGARDRHGRRRRRADGDRHREAPRRGRRGHRRAPGRQGAGRVPRRHLHRGRDDR